MNFFNRLTALSKILIVVLVAGGIGTSVFYLAPGLRVSESKSLDEFTLDDTELDNVRTSDMIATPQSFAVSTSSKLSETFKVAGYAWNGQTALAAANGGPFTVRNSIMEENGVSVNVSRDDWLSELRTRQLNFVEKFDKGQDFPDHDKSAHAIIIMGDGAPFYISTTNQALADKYGPNKYHVEVVGAIGMSNGEDKLIGPAEWKTNPQAMRGALVTTVIGDGDWVTTLNFAFANNIPVNPQLDTYDPNALNFYASANDDYIESAKELIKSQQEGFTVSLKVVENGKLTGETIDKTIDGCATWTPGDKMVFDKLQGFTDIASTADFPNQMATTVIVVKEWAAKHPDIVTGFLKSCYTASNQIKQYDEWARYGATAIQKTFDAETPDYWYNMFKGQTGTKAGITYNMGGTRVVTYGDAMQYYGISADGINRYRAVYEQVSKYLTELNPFGFNEQVKAGITPYSDAVNLFYLKNIEMEAGEVTTTTYTETATEVMANGEWNSITFNTGSADLKGSSNSDLETIYNLLVQAEQTKLSITGHTDNTGSDAINNRLSAERAQSVRDYFVSRGISPERFQTVEGAGSTTPIASNANANGRTLNRRVQITLLQ